MNLLSFSVTTLDQYIAEIFNNNFGLGGDFSWGNIILCIIAIVLTILLTGIIGLEREKRGRTAGLRTHLLVGIGSCIIMIISIYGFPKTGDNRDVARLAAGIVTGVGFLGAGTIVHNNGSVKGLTTASTIWLAMAIGLACGSMNFVLAILGGLFVWLVLVMFRKIEAKIAREAAFCIVTAKSNSPVLKAVIDIANTMNLELNIISQGFETKSGEELIEISFKVISKNNVPIDVELLKKELISTGFILNIDTPNMH